MYVCFYVPFRGLRKVQPKPLWDKFVNACASSTQKAFNPSESPKARFSETTSASILKYQTFI